MRNRIEMPSKFLILILFVPFFLLGGCAATISFRTVDAFTGAQLEGVEVSRTSSWASINAGSYMHHFQVGITNAEGSIVVGPMSSSEQNTISFKKQGYFGATAFWGSPSSDHVTVYTQDIDPQSAAGRRSIDENFQRIVVVPMFRDNLPKIPPPVGTKPESIPNGTPPW